MWFWGQKQYVREVHNLMRTFRNRGYNSFRGMNEAPAQLDWPFSVDQNNGIANKAVFSRLCLYLAMNDYNFPLNGGSSVDKAYLGGYGEWGLDGVAVAVGNQPIYKPDDVKKYLAAHPEAPVRILFLQGRLPEKNQTSLDILNFTNDIQNWLSQDKNAFLDAKNKKHADAVRQWEILDHLRDYHLQNKRTFAPEVIAVFAFGGIWDDMEGASGYLRQAAVQIKAHIPEANVEVDFWSAQDIVASAAYADLEQKCDLDHFESVKLPKAELPQIWSEKNGEPVNVLGYSGYIAAEKLLKAFSRVVTRKNTETGHLEDIQTMDFRYFLENPRYFLKLAPSEKSRATNWNVGAVELQNSLREENGAWPGQSSLIGYGHNGVVIVTRAIKTHRNGRMTLIAPQVVNGCQSCFVLDENRDHLKGVSIPLKVIVTENESVKNFVITASNTQQPIDAFDLFSRWPEVRHMQRQFLHGLRTAKDKIWLRRRWNEPLEEMVDFDRTILARDLLEVLVSCFYGLPHAAQDRPKDFLSRDSGHIRFGRDLFAPSQSVKAYKAIAWMFLAHKQFLKILKGHELKIEPLPMTFHVYAIWRLLNSRSDDVDIDASPQTDMHFEQLKQLVLIDMYEQKYRLTHRAAKLVWALREQGLRGEKLTEAIRQKTSIGRSINEDNDVETIQSNEPISS